MRGAPISNRDDYNYSSDEDTMSDSFEYFLILLLICSSWVSCYEIIKKCTGNCIKSFRIKNKTMIKN